MPTQILRFANLELDRDARHLSRGSEPLSLQPKTYDLLVYLVEHRSRVVAKEELLQELWRGEAVVPSVLTTAVGALRKALGDDARAQRFVRTVPSVGYQFIGELVGAPSDAPPKVAMARHDWFVGRQGELELFDAMLDSKTRLLYVHGPGGIGKTSVLQKWVHRCDELGRACVQLDAEHMPARPAPFEDALAAALGIDPRSVRQPVVIFIDNFDFLATVARWFRETLWPQMPDAIRFVLAARTAPDARWRVDGGWRSAGDELALPPFGEDETCRFLQERGIAGEDVGPLFAFTGGHPLALAIAADAVERGANPQALPTNREVIDALVETFTDRTPSAHHRRALETASLLSSCNERLLDELAGAEDPGALYDWLSTLSFVHRTRDGLQVHALVREAVLGQLRWKDPDRLRSLAAACYEHHFALLDRTTNERDRVAITVRIMSLGRHNPDLRPYYADDNVKLSLETAASANEHDALCEMVRRFEGESSASILDRWLRSGHATIGLVRDELEVPAGFTVSLKLPASSLHEMTWDPALRVIVRHLHGQDDWTNDDEIVIYRWLVSRDAYQDVGAVLQRCHEVLNHELHTMSQSVAYTFVVYGEPDVWAEVNDLAEHEPLSERFTLGRRHYGLYGHSWRRAPLDVWVKTIVAKLSRAGDMMVDEAAPTGLRRAEPSGHGRQ